MPLSEMRSLHQSTDHKFLFDIIVLMQQVMDEHMFHSDYYPSLTVCPSCLPIA